MTLLLSQDSVAASGRRGSCVYSELLYTTDFAWATQDQRNVHYKPGGFVREDFAQFVRRRRGVNFAGSGLLSTGWYLKSVSPIVY